MYPQVPGARHLGLRTILVLTIIAFGVIILAVAYLFIFGPLKGMLAE